MVSGSATCGDNFTLPSQALETQACLEVRVGDPTLANDSVANGRCEENKRGKKDMASKMIEQVPHPLPPLPNMWPGMEPDMIRKQLGKGETITEFVLKNLRAIQAPTTCSGLQSPPGLELDGGLATEASSIAGVTSIDSATSSCNAELQTTSNKFELVGPPLPHLLGDRERPVMDSDMTRNQLATVEACTEFVLKSLQATQAPTTCYGLQPPPGLEIDCTPASMCEESTMKESSTTEVGRETPLCDAKYDSNRQHTQNPLHEWLAPKSSNRKQSGLVAPCNVSRSMLREKGQNALGTMRRRVPRCGENIGASVTMNLNSLRARGDDVLADVCKSNLARVPDTVGVISGTSKDSSSPSLKTYTAHYSVPMKIEVTSLRV